MDTVINRYQYFLNSAQAEIGKDGSAYCEFQLNRKLTLTNSNYQFEVTVNRVNLPFSFYQWNATNNTLPYLVNWGASSATSVLTITPGNYTLPSLISEINTLLLPSLASVTSGFVTQAQLNFVYNQNSNKLKIQLLGTPGFTIVFSTCDISYALGYRFNWALISNGLYASGGYTVNVNPIMNVYVTSSTFQDNTSFSALNGRIDTSNIIAIVPITHSPLFYEPSDFNSPIRIRLTNETLSNMDFNIIDSKGRELVFDQPWSIQLTIDEVYVGPANTFVNMHDIEMNATQGSTSLQGQSSDLIQELKNQILNESHQYVQKRQTSNQTRMREVPVETRASKRKSTITTKDATTSSHGKTTEAPFDTSDARRS